MFGNLTKAQGVIADDLADAGMKIRISVRLVDPSNSKRLTYATMDVNKEKIPD